MDEDVKDKYGLELGGMGKGLVRLEPGEAEEEYERARARRSTRPASTAVSSWKRVGDLSTTLRRNTVERYNPFDLAPASASASASSEINRVGRGKAAIIKISGSKVAPAVVPKLKLESKPTSSITALGGLAGYGSDEDDEEGEP